MSLSPSEHSPRLPQAGGEPSTSTHLSYPATISLAPTPSTSLATASQTRQVLKDRLYVGNLHPSVDEYTLIQLFSKFGKLSHLDYLFHKSGPLKGKPRGYAFVEFADSADAERALSVAHNKLLRGRRLVVTHAHQAPLDAAGSSSGYRRSVNEAGRPTALSLLKSGMKTKTKDKIALMEAKLRQIEQDKARETHSTSPGAAESSTSSAPSSSLPVHPSLPLKPSAHVQALSTAAHSTPPTRSSNHSPSLSNANKNQLRSKRPLAPKRPVAPQASSLEAVLTVGLGKPSGGTKPSATGPSLKGVKIKRKKVDSKPVEGLGERSAEGAETADSGTTAKTLVGLGDGYGSDMDE